MARRTLVDVLWGNILVRSALWYVLLAAALYWFRDLSVGGLGPLGDQFSALFTGRRAAAADTAPVAGPTMLPTAVAMLAAFLFALPVAWIYTLTRRKKGWKQSVVQTLIVLPVIIAGILVLVKYSLELAFGLGAIVAAVRFRNTLDDTKDIAFILIGIGIGLAAAVDPQLSAVLSFGFNALIVGLWYTDFGRTPAALEGKMAERQLEKALEHASRTGTFVARMDDEVFKALSGDQLEAVADRAWRRRKRNAPELDDSGEERPAYSVLLRLRTAVPDEVRAIVEPHFGELFARWRFGDVVHEDDGMHVVEYAAEMAETVTPGVVSDTLRSAAGPRLVRLELR